MVMSRRRVVGIEIVEEDGKSFVVRTFDDGKMVREPVVHRKKTRKPKRPPLRITGPRRTDE
jgi:hypothetical protein